MGGPFWIYRRDLNWNDGARAVFERGVKIYSGKASSVTSVDNADPMAIKCAIDSSSAPPTTAMAELQEWAYTGRPDSYQLVTGSSDSDPRARNIVTPPTYADWGFLGKFYRARKNIDP